MKVLQMSHGKPDKGPRFGWILQEGRLTARCAWPPWSDVAGCEAPATNDMLSNLTCGIPPERGWEGISERYPRTIPVLLSSRHCFNRVLIALVDIGLIVFADIGVTVFFFTFFEVS